MCVCKYVCMHACMYVCICMYVYNYVCMYICMYVDVCVCVDGWMDGCVDGRVCVCIRRLTFNYVQGYEELVRPNDPECYWFEPLGGRCVAVYAELSLQLHVYSFTDRLY